MTDRVMDGLAIGFVTIMFVIGFGTIVWLVIGPDRGFHGWFQTVFVTAALFLLMRLAVAFGMEG